MKLISDCNAMCCLVEVSVKDTVGMYRYLGGVEKRWIFCNSKEFK